MSETIFLADVLRAAAARLQRAGVPTPEIDATLLAAHVLGVSRGRVQALAVVEHALSLDEATLLEGLLARREAREPLQHITGVAPFLDFELRVGAGVFVPRPESEVTASVAIALMRAHLAGKTEGKGEAWKTRETCEKGADLFGADFTEACVADSRGDLRGPRPDPFAAPVAIELCAGSCAISVALARAIPDVYVWALELSERAAAWGRANARRLGEDRVRVVRGDVAWLEARQADANAAGGAVLADATELGSVALFDERADVRLDADVADMREAFECLRGRAQVIVANPPYIPVGAVPRDAEVRLYDPELALYSGGDGLDAIRVIARVAGEYAARGGVLVLEHGELQGEAVRAVLAEAGWCCPQTRVDFAGRDRVTFACAR